MGSNRWGLPAAAKALVVVVLATTMFAGAAPAAQIWMWDTNQNRIDDRIDAVQSGDARVERAVFVR